MKFVGKNKKISYFVIGETQELKKINNYYILNGDKMRAHLYLTKNTQIVPFDYQDYLIGRFHHWLGKNNLHDDVSLYSISWLKGAKKVEKGYNFSDGAEWFISVWDEILLKKILKSILDEPEVCCGMKVGQITLQETPEFGEKERFIAASPILIRDYSTNPKGNHLVYSDEKTNKLLTDAMNTKLKRAGIVANVNIRFDNQSSGIKTKVVKINGLGNKANFCPVIIEGDKEAVQFAWNVGIGHSTGCCFGAIY